ncbi:MAG: cache domain-containing protein, partial [Candidatus Aminicenantes bacterium]|nr:cache domain-containing protein [Candidatus Aminicenantes bacterium]
DVQALVQCAYEFVQEVGFESTRNAFHEEDRWRSGPLYIFVDEKTPDTAMARAFVYPPDPSREGTAWGLSIDAYGNDVFRDANRIIDNFGEGWLYNSFVNPATGREEPKVSYIKGIDWEGIPAFIGAGIYRRDIPGTCLRDEVNAMELANDPSDRRLQEFVRCAAMELESMGYFASVSLSGDPRWRRDSIYVFGVDGNGNTLFSGDPYRWGGWTLGGADSELTSLSDRDDLSVADAFGETFLYYMSRDPSTGMQQRKVVFVKRVVAYGLPILIGSGYYLEDGE